MITYYNKLKNRIFKILVIFETDYDNFYKYIDNIYCELDGNNENYDQIIQIKFKINYIKKNEVTHNQIKRIVFESLNLLDKIIERMGGDDKK